MSGEVKLLGGVMANGMTIEIVGLGYVGLPLAVEFCKQGFDVYGVDKAPEKIELLRKGKTYENYS